ncbi:hypothetical protein [Promicromonospora iranensis]|jgi:hypothetical protein|uniref:hypothetical protein n=1 Tax=Promicromonospora iranensis TaxID=1105144 RepID=UPI0023A96839|nr:hypothetical protein [Promicromonospora iranensis]
MRSSSKVALVGALVVVVGGGAVATPVLLDAAPSQADQATTDEAGLRPVRVERGSLASGTVLSGTLSRGAAEPLTGTADGVLTALPAEGSSLRPGERLFEVNGRPTFLLRGDVPLWRPLQLGSKGKDVLSLNQALADAGLLARDRVDDVFGSGTSAAVADLFESAGYAPPSGTEEGRERITRAENNYDGAVEAREDAAKALEAASEGPSGLDVALADAAVADADAALAAARQSGEGLALAQVQYDTAVADRGALDKVPDASAQLEAFEDAQKSVTDATKDLEIARAESVSPPDVVILDVGKVRVASVPVRVGDPATGEVLTWTGTTVHAEAQVTRSQQASLSAGEAVTVWLPDGSKVAGVIRSTTPARTGGADGGGADTTGGVEAAAGDESDMATVRIDIEAQEKLTGSVGAAVRIEVVTDEVQDALVVPVTALVALAEGGYAVEKVVPDAPRGGGLLVPVEVGLVAEAKVQITSTQLEDGDEVLVP